jgi:hypothetical protein
MAKKIRFPLKMKNGAEVRSLEELKENFDLESVLGYFTDGKLATWLADRYYDEKAAAVSALSADMSELNAKLCEILEVDYQGDDDVADLEYIQRRNEKLRILNSVTADQDILNNIDHVAMDQNELYDILDESPAKVYLYGEKFEIPFGKKNICYIGINKPLVIIDKNKSVMDYAEAGITFNNVVSDNDSFELSVPNNNNTQMTDKATKLYSFGLHYEPKKYSSNLTTRKKRYIDPKTKKMVFIDEGDIIIEYKNRAYNYYVSAAELGNEASKFHLLYLDNWDNMCTAAVESWLYQEMNNNNLEAEYILASIMYEAKIYKNGADLLKDAADKGHLPSMARLGYLYGLPNRVEVINPLTREPLYVCRETGVNFDLKKSNELIQKAREGGYFIDLPELGFLYEQNKEYDKALECYFKLEHENPLMAAEIDSEIYKQYKEQAKSEL